MEKEQKRHVIFDLDGCLADDRSRLGLIQGNAYDAYHALLEDDAPMHVALVRAWVESGAMLHFFTARPEAYRIATKIWLAKHYDVRFDVFSDHSLFMRGLGDKRTSPELKVHYMLDRAPMDVEAVTIAYDDRWDVLAAYAAAGIKQTGMLTYPDVQPYDPLAVAECRFNLVVDHRAPKPFHPYAGPGAVCTPQAAGEELANAAPLVAAYERPGEQFPERFFGASPSELIYPYGLDAPRRNPNHTDQAPEPVPYPDPVFSDSELFSKTHECGDAATAGAFFSSEFLRPGPAQGASTTERLLRSMAETYAERNKVYGDNFRSVGPLMKVLFPDGAPPELLHAPHFHLFELLVVKLSRFANSNLTHQDSIHDAAVYAAMIQGALQEAAATEENS